MKQQQLGDIVIRLATEADAATIGSGILAQECGHKPHANSLHGLGGCIEENRLAVWSQRLRDHPPAQLVDIAFDLTGRAQAFVCSFCDFDPVWGSLVDNLRVLPQARGQGIGERLFRAVVDQLSERDSVFRTPVPRPSRRSPW